MSNFDAIFGSDMIQKKMVENYNEQYRELAMKALVIDASIKTKALIKLLVNKGVFTIEEYNEVAKDEEENGELAEQVKQIETTYEQLNELKEVVDAKDYDKLIQLYKDAVGDNDPFADLFKSDENPFI